VYSYQPTNDDHDDPLAFLKASLSSKSSDEVYTSHSVTNGNERGEVGVVGGTSSTIIDLSGGAASLETDMYSDADENDTASLQPTEPGQVLWTFNYFFVNKQAKRIVLFTCIETMMRAASAAFTEEAREENANQSDGRNNATDQSNGSIYPNHSIPEHTSVHHDAALLHGGSGTQKSGRFRRSPSLLSTTSSLSSGGGYGGSGGPLDDDESLYEDNGAANDNDSTTSSSVSVADFDLDPADAVSGGIAIDTA
jgi:hypothetical protein